MDGSRSGPVASSVVTMMTKGQVSAFESKSCLVNWSKSTSRYMLESTPRYNAKSTPRYEKYPEVHVPSKVVYLKEMYKR